MVQDRAIVTMADQQKVVCDLSNGAIFNDLNDPYPRFKVPRHYLTLNISETVRDSIPLKLCLIVTYRRPLNDLE